jgi:hypothetical protein
MDRKASSTKVARGSQRTDFTPFLRVSTERMDFDWLRQKWLSLQIACGRIPVYHATACEYTSNEGPSGV